jgi:hypothetical protein
MTSLVIINHQDVVKGKLLKCLSKTVADMFEPPSGLTGAARKILRDRTGASYVMASPVPHADGRELVWDVQRVHGDSRPQHDIVFLADPSPIFFFVKKFDAPIRHMYAEAQKPGAKNSIIHFHDRITSLGTVGTDADLQATLAVACPGWVGRVMTVKTIVEGVTEIAREHNVHIDARLELSLSHLQDECDNSYGDDS